MEDPWYNRGAFPWIALKHIRGTLNVMRFCLGSQCSRCSSGVMRQYLGALCNSLAHAFWTRCNFWILYQSYNMFRTLKSIVAIHRANFCHMSSLQVMKACTSASVLSWQVLSNEPYIVDLKEYSITPFPDMLFHFKMRVKPYLTHEMGSTSTFSTLMWVKHTL